MLAAGATVEAVRRLAGALEVAAAGASVSSDLGEAQVLHLAEAPQHFEYFSFFVSLEREQPHCFPLTRGAQGPRRAALPQQTGHDVRDRVAAVYPTNC